MTFPRELLQLVPEMAPYRYFTVEGIIAVVRPSSCEYSTA
jgi:hypothetical protein